MVELVETTAGLNPYCSGNLEQSECRQAKLDLPRRSPNSAKLTEMLCETKGFFELIFMMVSLNPCFSGICSVRAVD